MVRFPFIIVIIVISYYFVSMMSKKKSTHKPKARILILTFIITLLLGITAVGAYFFLNIENLLNKHLSDFVYEKTQHTYRFSFNQLNVDLSERSLTIDGLLLAPDSLHADDSTQTRYRLNTSRVKFSHIELWPFLSRRKVKIGLITSTAPDIRLNTGEQLEFNRFSKSKLNKGDTLKLPYLSEIFIDTLRIERASFNIDTLFSENYDLPEINIEASHFKLGGKKYTDSPFLFDVSDIRLLLENLSTRLPDSIHQMHIENIELSLIRQQLSATNVNLQPFSDTLNNSENQFHISVPHIVVKTDQLQELLHSDTISFQSMELLAPSMSIKFGSKILKGTPINEVNLYQLIENKLQLVSIDHFNIRDADLKLIPSNSDSVVQHFEMLDVNFYDFKADSTAYKDPERILSSKDFDLKFKKFTLKHIDGLHQLLIQQLAASSHDNKVQTGQIRFVPVDSNRVENINTVVETTCQTVQFNGIDFHEWYHHQTLPMQELIIEAPHTEISFENKQVTQTTGRDKSIILDKTKDYLSGIYVEKTSITKGRVQYNYIDHNEKSGFFKSNYQFTLDELSVDSATFYQSDKIFFAETFDLNFSDLQLQLADEMHDLKVASLHFSSKNQIASIENLKIEPANEPRQNKYAEKPEAATWLHIEFPKVSLHGANLHDAFFNKKLHIDQLTVTAPEFNILRHGKWEKQNKAERFNFQTDLYSLIDDYMQRISISRLNIVNGELKLTQQQNNQADFSLSNLFSATLTNFTLDAYTARRKNQLLFSDEIDLILKEHSFTLADGVHKIDAAEIGLLSSSGRVYIKNARLYPDILSKGFKKTKTSFFANIPDLQISNANIFRLFNEGILTMDEVIFNQPHISLLIQKDAGAKQKQNNDNTEQPPVLDQLHSIAANVIKINDGELELARYENFEKKVLFTSTVNFGLNSLKINHQNDDFSFNYYDFNFLLDNLHFQLADKVHTSTIEHLTYQHRKKYLLIDNLLIKPAESISGNEKKLTSRAEIPVLSLEGFDLVKLIKEKTFHSSQLIMHAPKIYISDKRIEKESKFSPYTTGLYSKIGQIATKVQIDRFSAGNISLTLDNTKKRVFDRLQIDLHNFLIDEKGTNDGRLLNAESVSLNIEQLGGKTPQGFYRYQTRGIKVHSDGRFKIDQVQLTPLLSRKEFARAKRYQADYFTIEPSDFSGSGLNVRALLEENKWQIESLNSHFSSVSIFRDKTYPLDPAQIRKMPQQALRDLNINLSIDTARINATRFDYWEIEPDAVDLSHVFVNDIQAEISNISNESQRLASQPIMKASIDGLLMGKGATQIKMNFNIPSFGNEFTFDGTVSNMQLAEFNPITEPGLKLSIREGYTPSMQVFFEANGDSAIGQMRFYYNDLKISVLNKKGDTLKEGKLASFLVNSIALKSDNPRHGNLILPSRFVKHRDKQRSVVGYCWQSVYAGIKSTLGIKEKDKAK